MGITPRPEVLIAQIRFLSETTELVIFSDHAQERMDERGISDLDVYEVLKKGMIKSGINPGKRSNEWACKITYNVRGSREIGTAVVVMNDQKLWITTVEWEDL